MTRTKVPSIRDPQQLIQRWLIIHESSLESPCSKSLDSSVSPTPLADTTMTQLDNEVYIEEDSVTCFEEQLESHVDEQSESSSIEKIPRLKPILEENEHFECKISVKSQIDNVTKLVNDTDGHATCDNVGVTIEGQATEVGQATCQATEVGPEESQGDKVDWDKFSIEKRTTTCQLEYLHSDLWGPSTVQSIGGTSYFMSIVDDYSRKVWVILLKSKYQALNSFKDWKKVTKNHIGRKVKMLRTDNGLEFCSSEFNDYYRKEGIARRLTIRKTPQQNGLAEIMNRSLLERVRCFKRCIISRDVVFKEDEMAMKPTTVVQSRQEEKGIQIEVEEDSKKGSS
ncbi:uncharacterized protein LOC133792348 [Humulus lupulus]|uniref:uncharacterized protein LOC133792348 n=1 Tax=Humulus lupulus TaxID=3486 RepID=UPI002B4181F7|nr:uncharacterized protein LOC133792348 [Humulus lupulus]